MLFRSIVGLFSSDENGASSVEDVVDAPDKVSNEDAEPSFDEDGNPLVELPKLTDNERFALSGLVNSYIFGTEFSGDVNLSGLDLTPISSGGSLVGVNSVIAAGQDQIVNRNAYQSYVAHLAKIDNAMAVDLYEYLSRNVDRRGVLRDHVLLLNQLLFNGESIQATFQQEMNALDAEYDSLSIAKDEYENGYFDSISGFQGDNSYNYLQLFVDAGQRQVKLKAYYNALSTLDELYEPKLFKLRARIQDITLNSDALIKGVRVFEVHDSNIDAIILER